MHPGVHCSTSHDSQDMEETQMSVSRGLDEEDVALKIQRNMERMAGKHYRM